MFIVFNDAPENKPTVSCDHSDHCSVFSRPKLIKNFTTQGCVFWAKSKIRLKNWVTWIFRFQKYCPISSLGKGNRREERILKKKMTFLLYLITYNVGHSQLKCRRVKSSKMSINEKKTKERRKTQGERKASHTSALSGYNRDTYLDQKNIRIRHILGVQGTGYRMELLRSFWGIMIQGFVTV